MTTEQQLAAVRAIAVDAHNYHVGQERFFFETTRGNVVTPGFVRDQRQRAEYHRRAALAIRQRLQRAGVPTDGLDEPPAW